MLHNIEPHEYHCEFLPRPPISERDYLLLFSGEQILLKRENEQLILPFFKYITDVKQGEEKLRYLFTIDDIAFFGADSTMSANDACDDVIKKDPKGAWTYLSVRNLREFAPSWLAFAAITGYHLHFWYVHNRYCGVCGSEFNHSVNERALLCPHCGYLKYPEIAVAVIVGVTDGDKLLLTRYAEHHYKRYALIAGFVEIGESLEDTVRREVYEEAGLCVKNIRYFQSQPWGFSCSLLAGFFADLDGSADITLDGSELAEATWVERGDICVDSSLISLTATMMMAFKDNKTEVIWKHKANY
jgi:NAD+ diphosphatase